MGHPVQEIDELFDVKNYFYIGNYQQCINEAAKLRKPSTPEIGIQRDILVYRSYIAENKFLVVLDEITDNSPAEVQPWKLLAQYLNSKENRTAIIQELLQKMESSTPNESLILVAATILMNANQFERAYRYLHNSESLESMLYTVELLLKITRFDLAALKLKHMMEKDEESILTHLAQAWLHCSVGDGKIVESYYIYQELVDKHGPTPMLLNGLAVSLMGQLRYEEAESALQNALDRDSKNADTLINLITLHKHLNKGPETYNRYFLQLKDAHPEHPFLKDLEDKENEFNRICQAMTLATLHRIPLGKIE